MGFMTISGSLSVGKTDSWDLFQNGNYVSGFVSESDADEYMKTMFEELRWKYPDPAERAEAMNGMRFFLARSFKYVFEGGIA